MVKAGRQSLPDGDTLPLQSSRGSAQCDRARPSRQESSWRIGENVARPRQ